MTDIEIIQHLVEKDSLVTKGFFVDRGELFHAAYEKIIPPCDRLLFNYDKLLEELYDYLMLNNAKKLRNFDFSISLDKWMKQEAESFFSDKWVVYKLINHDKKVIVDFFFHHCKPLFQSVIKNVFSYSVDYDEIVNDLFIHLMENDARRLKTFKFEKSLYGWLKTVAIHYYCDKKNHDKVIDDKSKEPLVEKKEENSSPEPLSEARMDLERLMAAMSNDRYAKVIRKLYVEDMAPEEVAKEMEVTMANFYNIKKRAIRQLTQVAINDIEYYNKIG